MIRLACFLGLVALATVVRLAVRTDGASAIVFSFVGFPALALALAIYAVGRWRAASKKGDPSMHRTLAFLVVFTVAAGPALAVDPVQAFKDHCAKCHGETGKSDTAPGKALKVPPLAGDAKTAGMSVADIVAAAKANEKHTKAGVLKDVSDADLEAAATRAKELAGTK